MSESAALTGIGKFDSVPLSEYNGFGNYLVHCGYCMEKVLLDPYIGVFSTHRVTLTPGGQPVTCPASLKEPTAIAHVRCNCGIAVYVFKAADGSARVQPHFNRQAERCEYIWAEVGNVR